MNLISLYSQSPCSLFSLFIFIKPIYIFTFRQLRSLVDWVFSEPMLIYYLHLFRDRYWPDGQLGPAREARSDDDKLKTRFMAKEKFTKNIPGSSRMGV